MGNKEEKNYKPTQPKIITYDYLFNYFGKDTFKGKIITGACVQLAIRVYKDGKEVKFTEEPKYENTYLCEIYKVSFARKNLFTVHKNLRVDNLFRVIFGWEKIESEVVGYTLNYLEEMPDEIMEDMPEQFKNIPCSSPMEVSEKDFRNFLIKHIEGFDISDNINAQISSVSYI